MVKVGDPVSFVVNSDGVLTPDDGRPPSSEMAFWAVTWSEAVLQPGLGRPLTRWERLRWRIKAPFWRLRYAIEDLWEITPYRVEGAWKVLTGRANWN